MRETLKRAISGLFYVIIMWLGASYSELSARLLFIILAVVSIFEMLRLRKGKRKFLAFVYILTPFFVIQLIISNIIEEDLNTNLILFMFVLTWVFDTFAYIVGVKFGKHKIMPSISPKKSWEGFMGGFIFTIIAFLATY